MHPLEYQWWAIGDETWHINLWIVLSPTKVQYNDKYILCQGNSCEEGGACELGFTCACIAYLISGGIENPCDINLSLLFPAPLHQVCFWL